MGARLALAVTRTAPGAALLAVTALMAGACAARTAEEAESGDPGAPMEITWLGVRVGRMQPNGPIQRAIEERFDVRLTNFTQNVGGPSIDVMIGAGEHPDAMYTFAEHDAWFDAGAYRSIPQDMIREHAPLLAGTLDDLGHAAWLLTAVPGTGGDELQGIPRHSVHQAGAQNMPAIRYDWFEQAGMTEALGIGHDRISTFESKAGVVDVNPVLAPGRFFVSYSTIGIPDLEEALERIVSLDPAGEGRTIGMTSSNRGGGPVTTGPGATATRDATRTGRSPPTGSGSGATGRAAAAPSTSSACTRRTSSGRRGSTSSPPGTAARWRAYTASSSTG